MTDKELHKLRRQDLLQMLLEQVKETDEVRKQLEEKQTELQQSEETCEHLKKRLDEKDSQINKLKGRLDKKDTQIHELRDMLKRWQEHRQIELTEAGSIAEAAIKLNKVFEAAQEAADQYLYNIKLQHDGQDKESKLKEADEELLRQIDEDMNEGKGTEEEA